MFFFMPYFSGFFGIVFTVSFIVAAISASRKKRKEENAKFNEKFAYSYAVDAISKNSYTQYHIEDEIIKRYGLSSQIAHKVYLTAKANVSFHNYVESLQ